MRGDCENTKECQFQNDCQSRVCKFGKCQAPSCQDAVLNGAETAVDCGARDCAPGALGAHCVDKPDCLSGICVAEVCTTAQCTDEIPTPAANTAVCSNSAGSMLI